MKLDLDRQEPGRSEMDISGVVDLQAGTDDPRPAKVAGKLVIQNLEARVLVDGTVRAETAAECGRCLETFDLAWDVPVELMVLRDMDTDEGEGDTLVIQQMRGEVDLHEAIRESILLAWPIAPVCNADCRGLCPSCGADLNASPCDCDTEDVDPRWAALDDL